MPLNSVKVITGLRTNCDKGCGLGHVACNLVLSSNYNLVLIVRNLTMKLSLLFVSITIAASLTACGGGGGGDAPAPAPANTSFSSYSGTYITNCYPYAKGSRDAYLETVTITASGEVTAQSRRFSSTTSATAATCTDAAATVTFDLSVKGTAVLQAVTKSITAKTPTEKSGTAATAEFTLKSLTLGKGSLDNIPLPNATSKVGFLLEGNKLYVLSGTREADGLADGFSRTVLTKQ
jgi:hypothetical protein